MRLLVLLSLILVVGCGDETDRNGSLLCDFLLGEECEDGFYCRLPIGDCFSTGVCEVKPEVCAELYSPVCGCDGKTYGNECQASREGIGVAGEGPCA